jgi:hypothetical protein
MPQDGPRRARIGGDRMKKKVKFYFENQWEKRGFSVCTPCIFLDVYPGIVMFGIYVLGFAVWVSIEDKDE